VQWFIRAGVVCYLQKLLINVIDVIPLLTTHLHQPNLVTSDVLKYRIVCVDACKLFACVIKFHKSCYWLYQYLFHIVIIYLLSVSILAFLMFTSRSLSLFSPCQTRPPKSCPKSILLEHNLSAQSLDTSCVLTV
jgi:multisubunit Na+/H+ antiporter MnhF subunit